MRLEHQTLRERLLDAESAETTRRELADTEAAVHAAVSQNRQLLSEISELQRRLRVAGTSPGSGSNRPETSVNGELQSANNEIGVLREQIAGLSAIVSGLKDTVRVKDNTLADWEERVKAQSSDRDPDVPDSEGDSDDESQNELLDNRYGPLSPNARNAGAQAPPGSAKIDEGAANAKPQLTPSGMLRDVGGDRGAAAPAAAEDVKRGFFQARPESERVTAAPLVSDPVIGYARHMREE